MIQKLFTIFDEKAKAFLPIFSLPKIAMAVRTFSDCVNDPKHAFGAHPEDYTLYHIGEFSDTTALVTCLDTRNLIHNGLELQKTMDDLDIDIEESKEL